MKVGDLAAAEKDAKIELPGGEMVGFRYRPRAITTKFVESFENAETTEELLRLYCEVLISWDVEQEDGEPLPIEPESLGALPLEFLGKIWESILRAGRPGEGRGGSSGRR